MEPEAVTYGVGGRFTGEYEMPARWNIFDAVEVSGSRE